MPDRAEQLYKTLLSKPDKYKNIGKDLNSFKDYFSDTQRGEQLFKSLQSDPSFKGIGTDYASFSEYFGLKKKEPSQPASVSGSETSGTPLSTSQPLESPFAKLNPAKKNPYLSAGAPQSTKAEELPSTGQRFSDVVDSGIAMFGNMVSNMPSATLDLALKTFGTNPAMMGVAGLDAEMVGKAVEDAYGLPQEYNPLSPNNALANITSFIAEKKAERAFKGLDGGIIKALDEGKPGQAGLIASLSIAQSLPAMIGLVVARGAGASKMLTLGGGFGLGTAGAEYTRLKKENPNMDKNILYLNAIITGASEAGSELLGTGLIYDQARKLYMNGAKKEATEVLRKGFKGYLDSAFKKFFVGMSMLDEGSTEAVNQLVKNATDKWSGVRPDIDYTDGVADAFIVGVGAGGTFAAPFVIANKLSKGKVQEKQAKASKIAEDIDNPDVSPEAKEILTEKLGQANEELNDELDIANAEAEKLTAKQKAEAGAISTKIDDLNKVISDPNVSDAVKETVQAEIDVLDAELDVTLAEKEVESELDKLKKQPLKEPTIDEKLADMAEGNFASFTFPDIESVPDVLKDKISSTGETNGEKFVKATISKVEADYLLQSGQIQKGEPTDAVQKQRVLVKEVISQYDPKNTERLKTNLTAIGMESYLRGMEKQGLITIECD